jgi:hypothetical protein
VTSQGVVREVVVWGDTSTLLDLVENRSIKLRAVCGNQTRSMLDTP